MTMAVGFILGDYVYLASDKRTTWLNHDGSDKSYEDGDCKIFPLSGRTLVFCGGIVQATQPLKIRIMREFAGKELNERDFEKISELCRCAYEDFMQRVSDELKISPWLKDFVLSVIIADNTSGPRIIRFDIEDDFKPIVQSNQGSVVVKSAIEPSILWPEIQKIAKEEGKGTFNPITFIGKVFLRAFEMNASISAAHDLFVVPRPTLNSLAFQKIQAGTITAQIGIQSPIITGGTITGALFKTASSGVRLQMDSNGIISYNSDTQNGFYLQAGDLGYCTIGFNDNGVPSAALKYFPETEQDDSELHIVTMPGTKIKIYSGSDLEISAPAGNKIIFNGTVDFIQATVTGLTQQIAEFG